MNNSKILLIFFVSLVIIFILTKKLSETNENKTNNNNLFNSSFTNLFNIFNKKNNSREEADEKCFSKPNFSKENYTEFMSERLLTELSKFKNERRNLKGNC